MKPLNIFLVALLLALALVPWVPAGGVPHLSS
jgi:hypothetical protein